MSAPARQAQHDAITRLVVEVEELHQEVAAAGESIIARDACAVQRADMRAALAEVLRVRVGARAAVGVFERRGSNASARRALERLVALREAMLAAIRIGGATAGEEVQPQ